MIFYAYESFTMLVLIYCLTQQYCAIIHFLLTHFIVLFYQTIHDACVLSGDRPNNIMLGFGES